MMIGSSTCTRSSAAVTKCGSPLHPRTHAPGTRHTANQMPACGPLAHRVRLDGIGSGMLVDDRAGPTTLRNLSGVALRWVCQVGTGPEGDDGYGPRKKISRMLLWLDVERHHHVTVRAEQPDRQHSFAWESILR